MDTTLFLIVLCFSVLMIVGLVYLVMSPSSYKNITQEDTKQEENEEPVIENENRGRGLSRMNTRNRNRNQNQNQNSPTTSANSNNNNNNNNNNSVDLSDDSDSSDDQTTSDITHVKSKKIGTKKLEKLKRKEEKRKYNESVQHQREENKKKQEENDEIEKQMKAERLERERLVKQEEERVRLEIEKQETDAYNLIKDSITLEDSGDQSHNEDHEKSLLQSFIQYLKDHKMVLLEDIAMEFNLKTMDVVERINSLDKQGLISGVIDDRGKFIYVTKEEMESVVKFINKKGRVHIEALAAESNKLIDLNSKIIIKDDIEDSGNNGK